MKRILFAALLILALLPGASTLPALVATAQAPAAATSTLEAALKELEPALAADFAKDGLAGASIGVVSGSKLVWSRHFGYADVEAKRVPTNDSAYRIGSITKQFTALALLQLVEHEKLRLTDPVEKYVPEIKSVQKAHAGSPPITLLQVATMMSGLAREPRDCQDHSAGPVSGWQKKVLDCLPKTEYAFEPGTQYLYSNIGYATLGVAIERAAGHPFTTVVEQHTLKPLGMSRTAFEPTPEIRKDLAHGYIRREGKPDRTAPDRELDGRGYRVPNGALFSTITDLAKFVAWELGEGPAGVLKKETQDANYTRTYSANGSLASGYGLGFMLSRRGDVVMLGHGGSTAGYRASALVNRQAKLGVIVLRNTEPGGGGQPSFDAGGVAQRILERIVMATRPRPSSVP